MPNDNASPAEYRPHRVLFTDLDGTLLDLASYSYAAALEGIHKLKRLGIPIIFCSSKTRAEEVYYREALDIRDPFITENGSAVYWTNSYLSECLDGEEVESGLMRFVLGLSVARVRNILTQCADDLGLTWQGYANLPTAEVAEITGLDPESAVRASEREFSETVLTADRPVSDRIFDDLSAELLDHGLKGVRGSKYYTVSGAGADKGSAVSLVADCYRVAFPEIVTFGIGDGENDSPMLQMVDRPFLVQKPGGSWAEVEVPGLTYVEDVGPMGWTTAIQELVAK